MTTAHLASDTGIYNYDAVGNLLSIVRQSSASVSVIEISTASGPAGTAVTVFGTGFSATPGQNTVTFNGTSATVVSSTATQIVTSVPAGATVGPINVTAPGGSASSSGDFTVTASDGVPTIIAFTPNIGSPGAPVTIDGTGFQTNLANNRVSFNIRRSDVSSATTTSVVTSVPYQATSGRMSVATPFGKAVSSDDFFVPPFNSAVSDVEFTARMTVGGSKTVTINAGDKMALVVFDGVQGQQVTLNISSVTFSGPRYVAVNTPEGTKLISQIVDPGAISSIGPMNLPSTGSYTILVAAGIITVIAGKGEGYAGDGGPAIDALLSDPQGVAVDTAGNFFVADTNNHRIRKVDTNGIITTVAGNGIQGYSGDGGPATDAQLNHPSALTVDGAGNIYIVDFSNQRIRKVDTGGIITTVAGTGVAGYSGDGGPATSAQLAFPEGVAVDGQGNLYVADTNNHRIRKVNTSGTITTVAGIGTSGFSGDGGPATSAQFRFPYGVAVDAQGNLYIADTNNHRIRKVDTSGVVNTIAGNGVGGYSGDGGPAISASLLFPYKAVPDTQGNVFSAEADHGRIRKINSAGTITTVAGNGEYYFAVQEAPAVESPLLFPFGLAVDELGRLFIADEDSPRIFMVVPSSSGSMVLNLTSP